jgi:hypothetical protein
LWWNDLALLIRASVEDLADPVTVITFTQNEVKLKKVIDWETDRLAQVVSRRVEFVDETVSARGI